MFLYTNVSAPFYIFYLIRFGRLVKGGNFEIFKSRGFWVEGLWEGTYIMQNDQLPEGI